MFNLSMLKNMDLWINRLANESHYDETPNGYTMFCRVADNSRRGYHYQVRYISYDNDDEESDTKEERIFSVQNDLGFSEEEEALLDCIVFCQDTPDGEEYPMVYVGEDPFHISDRYPTDMWDLFNRRIKTEKDEFRPVWIWKFQYKGRHVYGNESLDIID